MSLAARVAKDPFVAHDVVTADIVEIVPARIHPDLAALLGR